MKSDKGQTYTLIGFALLIFAGVLLFVFVSQPPVYQSGATAVPPASAAIAETTHKTTKREAATVNYPLNINTATLEELMTIDGLGEKKASAIIEYREYLGGYKSVSQIMEIEGFSDGTYEKIAGYLTV